MTAPAPLRPRYGRLTAFGAAVVVTLVTLLGGLGVLPSGGSPSYAATRGTGDGASDTASGASDTATLESASTAGGDRGDSGEGAATGRPQADPTPDAQTTADGEPAVPYDSGEHKRIVFSISQQRVWLVEDDESVARTYLVSGSVTDNLRPGVYQVYSKSPDAVGIDDSGTMRYMVRFTYGENAAIGFHDIPVNDGHLVQTRKQLGTPLSHGCIRQWRSDAKALWDFAPVGTEVDVVA
jgi:lipoprotein-anchoring transpeptidase ErfK/SrfK